MRIRDGDQQGQSKSQIHAVDDTGKKLAAVEASQLRNKDAEEAERHLVRCYQNSLDDKGGIGYHGTSIEALRLAIKTGKLMPKDQTEDGYSPSIWVYPKKTKFPDAPPAWEILDERTALETVKGYASDRAEDHAFLSFLGLDISDRRMLIAAMDITEAYRIDKRMTSDPMLAMWNRTMKEHAVKSMDFLKGQGIGEEKIKAAVAHSQKRKGLVLLIGARAKEEYKITLEKPDEGLQILCPKGLGLRMITGLETWGDEEHLFMEQLRAKHGM